MNPTRDLFLAGAAVVCDAVTDERVAYMWDEPSSLEEQSVGSVASHLARGSVWVVGDYLDRPTVGGSVDLESASEYFVVIADSLTDAGNQAIRERGAAIARGGAVQTGVKLTERFDALTKRLAIEPPDRTIAVYAGKVMRLDDYLLTRMVEQLVHLTDLEMSLGLAPGESGWNYPAEASELVVRCAADIGTKRLGADGFLRAIFREDPVSPLPIL